MKTKKSLLTLILFVAIISLGATSALAEIPWEKVLHVRQLSKVNATVPVCKNWKPHESYIRLVCTEKKDAGLSNTDTKKHFLRISAESMRAFVNCIKVPVNIAKKYKNKSKLYILFSAVFDSLEGNQIRIEKNPENSTSKALEEGMVATKKLYKDYVYTLNGDVIVPFSRLSNLEVEAK